MEQPTSCARFEKGMELLSKRWIGLIVHRLLPGPSRFCAIESAIPISARLLSDRLKYLENEGIVRREVFPDTPVRVEYSLTEKGRALEPVVRAIEAWSYRYIDPSCE
ncbi:winged helix-turn-helix transcriptional regulator [Paenibacillus sp. GYB003]|uniref:winged helix-turn-helix transcriptional regulator n=1 Tax=Paenibacillus sp. GYB003 TaxID=2994392 RepID=UPI002F960F05